MRRSGRKNCATELAGYVASPQGVKNRIFGETDPTFQSTRSVKMIVPAIRVILTFTVWPGFAFATYIV